MSDDSDAFEMKLGAWVNIVPSFEVRFPIDDDPGDPCPKCGYRGWTPALDDDGDEREAYCDCAHGKRRRESDGCAAVPANLVCAAPMRNGIATIPVDPITRKSMSDPFERDHVITVAAESSEPEETDCPCCLNPMDPDGEIAEADARAAAQAAGDARDINTTRGFLNVCAEEEAKRSDLASAFFGIDRSADDKIEQATADIYQPMHIKLAQPTECMAADAICADIIPLASRRPIRSAQQLAAGIHNAGILVHFDYGASPSSRKYVELKRGATVIARDPMPTIMVQGADRLLVSVPVEVPGPNCLDALSTALNLTERERVAFRTRREDAEALLAEAAAESRGALETP